MVSLLTTQALRIHDQISIFFLLLQTPLMPRTSRFRRHSKSTRFFYGDMDWIMTNEGGSYRDQSVLERIADFLGLSRMGWGCMKDYPMIVSSTWLA